MSYTKGPYNAYIEEGLPILISGRDDLGSLLDGFPSLHIATIHTASGSVELPVEANARLFKAAPDLLEALRGLCDAINYAEHTPQRSQQLRYLASVALALVNKVEEGE